MLTCVSENRQDMSKTEKKIKEQTAMIRNKPDIKNEF